MSSEPCPSGQAKPPVAGLGLNVSETALPQTGLVSLGTDGPTAWTSSEKRRFTVACVPKGGKAIVAATDRGAFNSQL